MSRWRDALDSLWARNRVHCGPETSAAYRDLASIYEGTSVFGFDSGTRSGSWTAPNSWIVDHARLTGPDGAVIADWERHPLHLYTFSPPFTGTVDKEELEKHLFSVPDNPDRIPFHFRNQYRHWEPEWGFCLSQNARDALTDGEYAVDIAVRFEPGKMEMAEQLHQGARDDCLLLVGHFDHPHMCNDGLAGCLAGHEVIANLAGRKTHLSYRMLSTVEIIGSVFYAESRAKANNVREALFVATPGARAPLAYQTSFTGNSAVDRAMRHVLDTSGIEATEHGFRQGPLGNDEAAFDVGGVDIPCGSIMRAPFDSYHTDADTPDNVDDEKFAQMVTIIERVINIFERNSRLARKFTGLPCLSSPDLNLYLSPTMMSQVKQDALDGQMFSELPAELLDLVRDRASNLNYMMNVLPIMCDGDFTVLDVAEKVGLPFELIDAYTEAWVGKGLVDKHWVNPFAGR